MRDTRVNLQPGYVIHSRPYGDTSALLDVFTAECGRVGLVAKGARRQGRKGSKAGLLQPFVPLLLSFQGRNELKTLRSVESAPGRIELLGERLFSGLYLNELLIRLLQRDDPHPRLFAAYDGTVRQLAHLDKIDAGLRRFEMRLLEELGYRLELGIEGGTGLPISADGYYRYEPGTGLLRCQAQEQSDAISGADLLAMSRGDFGGAARRSARLLMRDALAVQLGGEPLKSRQLFVSAVRQRPNSHDTRPDRDAEG